ncbi:hypothetical protein F4779DRAFT_640369 [Xylariaceae sp. FL0662B]|nr:hypothetical protein F4779DRAFT_640369 [Xylariaceae sp. FL0662B]
MLELEDLCCYDAAYPPSSRNYTTYPGCAISQTRGTNRTTTDTDPAWNGILDDPPSGRRQETFHGGRLVAGRALRGEVAAPDGRLHAGSADVAAFVCGAVGAGRRYNRAVRDEAGGRAREALRDRLRVQTTNNEEEWTFRVISKTAVINAVVSLPLNSATVDSGFVRVKNHKDRANKDYSNEGLGASFKKWWADNLVKYMDSPGAREFEVDKDAAKIERQRYGRGDEKGYNPLKDLW